MTKDFHTFYQSIERAQSEFDTDTIIDVPNGPATNACTTSTRRTNCNNDNDTLFKAKFLHGGSDAISLNIISNANNLTNKSQSLSQLNAANYDISLGELTPGNDLVNNIIGDDVMRMEMQLEDGANESCE